MASVCSTHSVDPLSKTIRRIKSHEPGQRVMTEAIALLFMYYSQKYSLEKSDFITPSPEEYFDYLRHLQNQTYAIMIPNLRRRLSVKLTGVSNNPPFVNNYDFLNYIEPLIDDDLSSRLIQALAIGLRALTVYKAMVINDDDDMFKTHEPLVWYTSILFHDSLEFRARGLTISSSFVKEGIRFIQKNSQKMRIGSFFDNYTKFSTHHYLLFELLRKYLINVLFSS